MKKPLARNYNLITSDPDKHFKMYIGNDPIERVLKHVFYMLSLIEMLYNITSLSMNSIIHLFLFREIISDLRFFVTFGTSKYADFYRSLYQKSGANDLFTILKEHLHVSKSIEKNGKITMVLGDLESNITEIGWIIEFYWKKMNY